MSYPPKAGKIGQITASRYTRMMAIQKYGTACSIVVMGIRLSSQPPRRHPAIVPRVMPSTNESTVDTPTSTIVHGSACEMTSTTGVG